MHALPRGTVVVVRCFPVAHARRQPRVYEDLKQTHARIRISSANAY